MTWFNQIKKPKAEPVHTIKCSASQKGWILCCESYEVFIYNDSKEKKFINEALEIWVQNGSGRELVITPDKLEKKGYVITPGQEGHWFFDSKLDVYVNDLEILNGMEPGGDEVNPFLTPIPNSAPHSHQFSTVETVSEHPPALNGKTRKASSVPH